MTRKFVISLLLGVISLLAYADKQVDYREGDVLSQMSKSSQSIFIQYATAVYGAIVG